MRTFDSRALLIQVSSVLLSIISLQAVFVRAKLAPLVLAAAVLTEMSLANSSRPAECGALLRALIFSC
jgi:hypothetical protein